MVPKGPINGISCLISIKKIKINSNYLFPSILRCFYLSNFGEVTKRRKSWGVPKIIYYFPNLYSVVENSTENGS